MYTVRSDKRLNQVTVVVLQALHQIAEQHEASYFIIGATARDILMTHVFGIDATRATRDVDFAIALKDWEQFEAIKQSLSTAPIFSRRAMRRIGCTIGRVNTEQRIRSTSFPLAESRALATILPGHRTWLS